MPINFDTLKTSENNLLKLFLKFYSHVLASQSYLGKQFTQHKKISAKALDHIVTREKLANQYEAQILDEACWIISKDQPRATHLRYLIAIMRSIKDLERMGDFVERITRILYHQKTIDSSIRPIISNLMVESYDFAYGIYRHLHNGSRHSKDYYVNNATKNFQHFSAKYRAGFKEIGQKIFKSKKDINTKVAIFTAIKNIERNADHAFNILENFIYISQPDFYFRKESRKG